MMNDPSHKAMLYFLELLMNSDGPMTLTQLATRFFSSKAFTPDMREACGRTTDGLRKFLNRYPSLFHVDGNIITAVTVDLPPTPSTRAFSIANGNQNHHDSLESLPNSTSNTTTASSTGHDFGHETEAVKFFQRQLLKREERWVLIRSIAGHLSQASSEIRTVVGPQLDFTRFLLRHPHVFEVQGELVSLKDTFYTTCLPRRMRSGGGGGSIAGRSRPMRPKSLLLPGMSLSSVPDVQPRPTSAPNSPGEQHPVSSSSNNNNPTSLSMTANEYKAVIFLRKTILTKPNGSMSLTALFHELAKTLDDVRQIVGGTMVELEEFLRKHSLFFELSDINCPATALFVSCRCDVRRINVIITNGKSGDQCSTRTLTNQRGSVFHVAKLWGIIDLGGHEHVFFDKSIFKHLDDLQKHFKKDEPLYFNAILAVKNSRAKWRATQVWKETDRSLMESLTAAIRTPHYSSAAAGTTSSSSIQHDDEGLELCDDVQFVSEEIEAEMRRLLGRKVLRSDSSSSGGVHQQLQPVCNQQQKSAPPPSVFSNGNSAGGVQRLADVATQTLSTGDIMATKFFHEDDSEAV